MIQSGSANLVLVAPSDAILGLTLLTVSPEFFDDL
jgi:hypothetical protein